MKRLASIFATAALLSLGGLACFNVNDHATSIEGTGLMRFALIIETERSDVDASHYLLDQATGDVWRFDPIDRGEGRWLRMAAAPEDVRPLPKPVLEKPGEEER
jgi:hypothetical protein